jgi:hypothetical protein
MSMHASHLTNGSWRDAMRVVLLLGMAATTAHAQQVVVEGQRAATPERSCVQQVEREAPRDADATRIAIEQCLRTKMAERKARPAPARPQGLTP